MTGSNVLLQKLDHSTGWICRQLAVLGLLALILVSMLTVVDAVLRKFFSNNVHGLSDIVEWCMIIAVSACIPAMVWRKHAITVRVLGSFVPWRIRELLELLGHSVLLAMIVIISWQLSLYSYDIWLFGDVSMLLLWPKWPVWTAASAIWWFAALVQLGIVIKQIGRVVARHEPPVLLTQESV